MTFEKSLAANNRLSGVLIPSIPLTILIYVAFQIVDKNVSWTLFLGFGVAVLVFIVLIISGYRSKDIYYDKANMYLKGDNGVTTVPFSDVKRLKLNFSNATIMGFKFYQYRIEYAAGRNSLHEIRFWTLIVNEDIDDFEREVRKVNQDFRVEHWS